MWILWLAVGLLLLIFELITIQLTTIWFALGSFAALGTSLIWPDNVILQVIVFIVVSAISLILTRPLAKKIVKGKKNRLNADRCIGEEGVVTVAIDNMANVGQVKISGAVWSARSDDGSIIAEGSVITVLRIEGVKVIVKLAENS